MNDFSRLDTMIEAQKEEGKRFNASLEAFRQEVKAFKNRYPLTAYTLYVASASIGLSLLVDWLTMLHVLPLHIP